MPTIVESSIIPGVKLIKLAAFGDERGRFMEIFRKEWLPERTWAIIQCNRSDSMPGVLRGLHFHHHQIDYWHVTHGSLRVGLADLRRSSPAFGATETLELNAAEPAGLFIPIGVAHGFLTLTAATLTYIVDNYYDGADELGVAWNDPKLAIDWGDAAPILSRPRDQANRRLTDIPSGELPA